MRGAATYLYNMTIMAMGMYIKRIHKQHSSYVVTLPKDVMRRLQLKRGDYLRFEDGKKTWQVTITKVKTGAKENADHKSNIDPQD